MSENKPEKSSEGAPPTVAEGPDSASGSARTDRRLVMRNVALGAALFGGVALAIALDPMGRARGASAPGAEARELAAQPAAVARDPEQGPSGEQGSSLRGQVREVIDVTDYTYLRIEQPGQGDVWAAVPRASVKVGDAVVVNGPQRMTEFTSSTLKRTFDVIYFGSLGPAAGAGVPLHGGAASNPHAGGDPHAGMQGAPGDPHAKPVVGGDAVPVGKVAKADGPGARTVAEVYAARKELAGKPLRVRAVVVKSVPGVLGKTFLHVRDGSGEAANGDHDLTVTTDATPEVGSTVLVEGNVTLDKDFGSGYRYEIIVENARVVDG